MLPFVLLEAPKTPENSSRSKVGLEVGLGEGVPESRSEVGQKYRFAIGFRAIPAVNKCQAVLHRVPLTMRQCLRARNGNIETSTAVVFKNDCVLV